MSITKSDFILEDLISKIYQKEFPEHKLPTQRMLAQKYGVSRFTVQRALQKLESIGLVKSIQGDGIYIQQRALNNPLIYNSMIEVPYTDMQSRMLYLRQISPTATLKHIFNLQEGEKVWEFRRIRIVRYEMSQVETSYMPCNIFPELDQTVIEDSIQNYVMQQRYTISHFLTRYHAEPLPAEIAQLLYCRKGMPAMVITSRGILKNGQVFVFSKIHALNYECTYIIPFNKNAYISRR